MLQLSAAACPNLCSRRGSCSAEEVCSCFAGYTGADCSLKTCPSGRPWFAKPKADDASGATHTSRSQTCSAAGVCDYTTGECSCFDGFTGHACGQVLCRGSTTVSCSGHGQCRDMATLARDYGSLDDSVPVYDGQGTNYANWEASALHGCVCDAGWTGADCSQRQCPYGDSAVTTNQQRPAYRLLVDFSDVVLAASRGVRLRFAGQTSSVLSFASGAPSASACLAWLGSIPGINATASSCRITGNPGPSPAVATTVGLNQFEVLLSLGLAYTTAINPLFYYSGQPAASLFSCFFYPAISGLALTDTSSCSVASLDVARLTATALPAAGTTYYVVVSSVSGSPNSVMVRQHLRSGRPLCWTAGSVECVQPLSGRCRGHAGSR